MFTGIVQTVGRIVQSVPLGADGHGRRLTIKTSDLGLEHVRVGDSIAINGACMTVTSKTDTTFTIDVSAESLSKTAGFDALGPVNLERAMRLGDRLDGHLVSGHVDATGVVQRLMPVGESVEFVVRAPRALAKYLAVKGSLCVHGVSLTVNRVHDVTDGCDVSINLIPHTLSATTLGTLSAGSAVNLEIDLIARYCERMLSAPR
ncbi:MAG TPA: riboflavin synthase [Burkholderiaceae bacterium]|nr:riboflavin synthase [Burkholderiaceae bacterium]